MMSAEILASPFIGSEAMLTFPFSHSPRETKPLVARAARGRGKILLQGCNPLRRAPSWATAVVIRRGQMFALCNERAQKAAGVAMLGGECAPIK